MDSLSHILLGAAIGEVTLGKKIGRWGMAIGALAKTFPDFDLVYTGLDDPLLYMCHHRGHTHSLIWESIYGVLLAGLFYLLVKKRGVTFREMLLTWMLCLFGHSLLDLFTNYGTRLFLPFTNESFALNTIAIVDLVFTVPMLVLSIWSLFYSNKTLKRLLLNKAILVYCFIYLGMITINKFYMNHTFENALNQKGIRVDKFMTNPTILNNVLWYANAVTPDTLYTAEYSLLDADQNIDWTPYPRNMQFAEQHPEKNLMGILRWFSRGYSICEQKGDTLNYYCVKFGKNDFHKTELEKSFVFHYIIYPDNGKWKVGYTEPPRTNENFKEAFGTLWNRMLGNKKGSID